MRIRNSIFYVLCLIVVWSLALQAQDVGQPKKPVQLTMEDFDKSSVSTQSLTSPVVAGVVKEGEALTPNKTEASKKITPILNLQNKNAKALYEAALIKMENLQSGRMHLFMQTANGAEEMSVEYVAPNRMRIVKANTEIVRIDSIVHVNVDKQGWKSGGLEEIYKEKRGMFSWKVMVRKGTTKDIQVKFVGEELIGQIPMLKCRIIEKGAVDNYVWVGKDDGLLYLMESSSPDTSRQYKIIFYDLNENISITAPEQ